MDSLLFIFALLGLICISNALFVDTVLTSTLNGQQVVPTAGNPFTFGNAVCLYVRNGYGIEFSQLSCTVTHNVIDPVNVSIFVGTASTNGVVVYPFTVQYNPTFTQNFTISGFSDYSAAQQESDFLNGLWYIQFTTVVYPNGEIRGQLLNNNRAYAILKPNQAIPPAFGTYSHGIALGSYSFFNPSRLLTVNLQHNVLNPTGVEVRDGSAGQVGPLITRFPTSTSPAISSFYLTIGEEVDLINGDTYIQVLSATNPNGEIRGQFQSIDIEPEAGFTARLNGANENPPTLSPSVGCGIFLYDCNTRLFQYLIFHDINVNSSSFSAVVEQAVNGSSGTTVFALSRVQSPIYGALYLTFEEEYLLYALQLYVNIYSPGYPNGEIRGQIGVQYQYYAYLSGSQITPPVTTSAIGCATFSFFANSSMDYDIQHSVQYPISTDFGIGAIGQNGRFGFSFPNTISPIQGDITLDDDELINLVDGLTYINIRSSSYVEGEIRGQILRVNPCTVTRDNGISAPAPPQQFITNPNYNINNNSGNSINTSMLVVMFIFALFLFMI